MAKVRFDPGEEPQLLKFFPSGSVVMPMESNEGAFDPVVYLVGQRVAICLGNGHTISTDNTEKYYRRVSKPFTVYP